MQIGSHTKHQQNEKKMTMQNEKGVRQGTHDLYRIPYIEINGYVGGWVVEEAAKRHNNKQQLKFII